jgi:hypothetical protein
MHYTAAIVVEDERCRFAFVSSLLLDDGACLAGQVERFADTHREAVAFVGPLVVRMRYSDSVKRYAPQVRQRYADDRQYFILSQDILITLSGVGWDISGATQIKVNFGFRRGLAGVG